jgi:hypothetical protein
VAKEPNLGRAEFFALPFPGSRSVLPVRPIRLPLLAPGLITVLLITLPYEDTNPDAKLIASANMIVLNRNDNNAWTNDKRRIRFDVMATSDT